MVRVSQTGMWMVAALTAMHAARGQGVGTPAIVEKQAKAVDVPVTRVVLFSSGVGYFEHNGKVTGAATAELQFETAQINDVLKSLVVYDRSGGAIGAITYPANDPVNRTLRSFQVNLAGDPPLAGVLKQIRGAKVQVSVGDETVAGTLMGVEQKERSAGHGDAEKVISTFTVNIITDGGIRSVSLDDIRKLEIQDEKIKREMNQALAALVQARDQSKKTVTVHFDAKAVAGERTVGMGYLVEAPVWKTTYRLLLPDPTSKALAELQAWAIVENQTDNDWTDVSLSLVGGRPISFIDLLYQPLYISRPVITPDIIGSIVPQTYDNGITLGANGLPAGLGVAAPLLNLQSLTQGQQTQQFGSGGGGGGFGGGGNGGQGIFGSNNPTAGVAPANPTTDFTQGVAAIAEATKIGEMFHYTVDKVTLPRQQSSMIPIVAESIQVDRVSIYSPAVSAKYAIRGLRLHNGTGKYLLGGPVSVMDTVKEGHSYAGDAKIEDIPPGQSRLLSYALDQDALMQISKDQGDEALLSGSVVKGVLWLKYRSQIQREYTLQNKGDTEKTIVLEHPVADGYALKEPAQAVEKTDKVYRFEIKLPPKETRTLRVVLEQTRADKLALTTIENDPLMFYSQQGAISAKVKDVLQGVASKRAAIADLDLKIKAHSADRAQILQEEENIRQNIRVLPAQSKSQEDAIRELTARDGDLKDVNKQVKDLQAALDAARAEMITFLEHSSVE